jgi:hypothetical protein
MYDWLPISRVAGAISKNKKPGLCRVFFAPLFLPLLQIPVNPETNKYGENRRVINRVIRTFFNLPPVVPDP